MLYQNKENQIFQFTELDKLNGFIPKEMIKLTEAQLKAYANRPEFGIWNGNGWDIDLASKEEYEKSLIPKFITLRQARLYLLSIDLLDDLENIINQNRAYQIEWEYANQIERESPLVKILGQTLNLNDEQIDNMFMEASKI